MATWLIILSLFLTDASGLGLAKKEDFPNVAALLKATKELAGKFADLETRMKRANGRYPSNPTLCEGRLTTESGVGVSTSDRTAQSTIYFTPYLGSTISLYDGSHWNILNFSQASLSLAGLTSDALYDVFAYENSGSLALELSALWANDTTRTDALTTQNGTLVKNGALTRRFVGTIRTTSATTTEDSSSKRFVWNKCNPFVRFLKVVEATDSWTYTGDAWQAANAAAGNKVEFVIGEADTMVEARALSLAKSSSGVVNYVASGVGVDSATVNSASLRGSSIDSGAMTQVWSHYVDYPGLGYHYLQWIERAHGTTSVTFYGDRGNSNKYQSGLVANIRG